MDLTNKMKFVPSLPPALTAGVYKVAVKTEFVGMPKAGGALPAEIGAKEEWLLVGGERFFIKPSDIDSIYPPDNGLGKYDDVLPHIVFYRAGFPWERKVGGTEVSKGKPWLALLLFDEDDPAPTPKAMPIGELVPGKRPGGIWFSDFKVAQDEDPNALCTVIDVPKALFDQIKPALEDLPWLAHGRTVSTEFKAQPAGDMGEPDGSVENTTHQYSVVIGNRFPRQGKESIVHLVSLEGFEEVLKDTNYSEHTVRMVSLKSWRFQTESSDGSFFDYVKRLNNGLLREKIDPAIAAKMKKPDAAPDPELSEAQTDAPLFLHFPFQEKQASAAMRSFLTQGYIPMEHKFRQGLTSISWYRGPLAPLPIPDRKGQVSFQPPFPSADALLVYDPQSGYYDVSYAAAWQLGQLLALRNKRFARAQFFWKQQASVEAKKRLEWTLLQEKLPVEKSNEDGSLMIPSFDDFELEKAENEGYQQSDALSDGAAVEQYAAPDNEELVNIITSYIKQLRVLRDVPYNYLVPDHRMLPRNAIRFFHIDPNWINALVDGAFSVGDITQVDQKRKKDLNKSIAAEEEPAYSGFLLRSPMLEVWPGLEVRAFKSKEKEAKPLEFVRLQRLGPDVLIAIVEGPIVMVELREPPEGLHFGVQERKQDEKGNPYLKKQIREEKTAASSPFYQVDAFGKVAVQNLAEEIGQKINKEKTEENTVRLDAGRFGSIMVENAGAVRLTIGNTLKTKKNG